MKIRQFLTPTLAAIALMVSPANAANILWIENVEGIDASWQTLLEANGHTLTAFTGNRSLPTQEDKDFVNSFDLVIINRSAFNASPTSGGGLLRDNGPVWNTQVAVPMIMMQAYLPAGHFSSNWGWTTTNAGGTHPPTVSAQPLTVHDAADSIWTGITIANGDPTPSALHTSNSHAISLALRPGAVIIVSSSTDNNNTMIARLPTGTAVGGGNLAGERLFFGMNSGTDTKNLTELGDQVFLNAITSLTGGFAPAGPFPAQITQNPDTPGTFDFEWSSQPGKIYDLLTSTNLATPIADWPVYDDGVTLHDEIPSAGETTTLIAVPSADARRFFAVREFDAPPPPPIFSADFETDGGGFTLLGTPNDWAWGTPNSNNNAGLVLTTGNDGSTGAWATNLGLGGTAPSGVIDPAADSILRSPDINLTGVTGAKLSFAAAYDASSGDVIEVLVRNAGTDALIATIKPVTATLPASSNWTTLGPFDLSAADNTNIYLEFRYDGTDPDYIGLYLDNVEVTPAP